MTDIVERIRNRIHDAPMPTEHLLDDAADEIERLRSIELQTRVDNYNAILASNNYNLDARIRLIEYLHSTGMRYNDIFAIIEAKAAAA